jgi:hypothetical protein
VLIGSALEGEPLAHRINVRRAKMIHRRAEVEEMLLRSGAFGKLDPPPFVYEFRDGHKQPLRNDEGLEIAS